jgi:hypothetical protein
MAATPVGDLFDKIAFCSSSIKIYANVQGQVGLQNIRTTVAGGYVGIFDSWVVQNGIVYIGFHATRQDAQNFRNPYYINYKEVNKLTFNSVPTWKKQGIDFNGVSTYVQNAINAMEQSLGSGTTFNPFDEFKQLFESVKKYAPLIIIGYFAIKLLPTITETIKLTRGKK